MKGMLAKDRVVVKRIKQSNCPKKFLRRFKLMRKFCKALDDTSGTSGSESIAELGVALKNNCTKWREIGILLPAKTPSNRARSRNENGWHLSTLKKKAKNSGLSVNDVLKADAEKEKRRQKRKRERAKAKKITTTSATSGAPRPQQRPRRNAASELKINGPVASTMNSLLS